jgi:iron complex outermembrane recepter protein
MKIAANYRLYPGHSLANAYFFNANSPGGVPDYRADLNFDSSSLVMFNQFGSFGFFNNGITAAVKTDRYRCLATYNYLNNNGYRQHNNEYWHMVNIALQADAGLNSTLTILGYYINGAIKLPGSLTEAEFAEDPYLADPRSINRDDSKRGTKGRVDLVYDTRFGRSLNNEVEISGFTKIESYTRITKEYKIVNKYGLGLTARYANTTRFGRFSNVFSVGGDLFMQPERTEEYEHFAGQKSDQLEQIKTEKTGNVGLFCSDNFEIIPAKLFLLFTLNYNNLVYKISEETLPSRADKKIYPGFSPNLAMKYKFKPWIAFHASYGLNFEPPDDNQLDSPYPAYLYNHELSQQKSKTFEVGVAGDIHRKDSALFFKSFHFEAALFNRNIENEIVPYEVYGDMFFRNAIKSNRIGFNLGGRLEILKDLLFEFTYTYSHFLYKSYPAQSLEADTSGNLVDVDRDFSGNWCPDNPANDLALSLSYEHPVVKKINIFAKLSYHGLSGLWVDDGNSDKTNAYNLLDGLLGIDVKFWKFNLLVSGGVNNLFDEIYVGYATPNSADRRFYNAGAPRNYCLSLILGYTF